MSALVAITVRATDSGGAFVEDSFNITVANSNDAPTVANPIPNQNATEDSAFNFQFAANTFADVDIGDTFTYSAAGLPAWLTFDAGTRTFSGTPANAMSARWRSRSALPTAAGAFVEDSFNITVANSNDAPTVANPIPNQNATEDSAFSFAFAANTFADVDIGDTFTYSAAGLPAWLTFDAGTRTFSGTPANANVGTVAITVRATDSGGAFVEDSFNITVANSNDAPTVANPIPNQNATEDSAFNFQFAANTFADVDIGDTFTYSAAGLPAWLTFDAGTRTFSGTPANADVGTVAITVRATDSGGAFVEDSFNITVANSNDAPTVANPIPNQNATEDSAFSFAFAANTFNDVDAGATLSYTAQLNGGGVLPGWLTFDAATRTFSGTPANADVGTVSIDVIADDGNGGTVTDTFTITVANSNDAPTVANPIPNQNATEDSAFSFAFAANTFNDVDAGATLSYTAQLNGGGVLPSWLTFDAATRTFSGTPANADVGTVSIDVIADDGNGGTVTDTFTITVANSNDAPTVANPIPNQNATEDSAFSFAFAANTFADVDIGDTFTYSAAGLPAWLTFDAGTRTFSGTPANANVGTVAITVRATDSGGAFVEDSFNITVANSNDAPTVANPIPNQNATEDSAFSFAFAANTFADVDIGDTFTYSAAGLPAWLTFDAGTRTFSGTPANANVGTVAITVRATDSGGAFVEDSFNITVANSNDAPTVANPIPNQNATEDSAFNFQFAANTFADVDIGDTFTYSAAGLPAWLTFDAGTRTFSGTPANANVGTVAITVRATDIAGAFVEDSFNITVANSNDAPTVANPIPNQNATENVPLNFTFSINTFADPDVGNTLSYSAQLAGGGALPGWLSFNALTRTFSGTPANADVGTVGIDVIANDGNGGTVTDTFNITVGNTNDAPFVANPIPNQNATEDSAFSFQFAANTFADPDVGDTLTYSAGSLPAWLNFDANTRTFSGTPLNADVGTISITVTATDGTLQSVDHTFDITVANTNDAPTVANPIPNQNATEDAALNFSFAANTFNDVDAGATLSYTAQLNGGGVLPGWLTFDAATRTFSGTPANADVGTVSIDVIADDGNGGTVTDTFTITVANSNDAPTVANPIPNQNATEDSAFSFAFAANTFNDVDAGATLSYTAQLNGGGVLPSWLTFDAATRTFSGTPANADVGTVSIDVIADDGNGGTVTDTFTITVANSNDAPTVANPIPNQNATEDSAFSFAFAANTFNDVDAGATLSYTAQLNGGGVLPGWLTFDAATRTFSGTPANADVGTVSIDVIADDGNGGTVTDTFTITVANSNDAPTVANPIPNQNATEDSAFSFAFAANTFNDVDAGATLSYTAQLNGGGVLPSWLTFDAATRTFSGTPANADVGTVSIDVIADDGNGGTVTDTFTITVANSNDAPTVANPIPNQNATEDSAFSFAFAANTFADVDIGDTFTYSAAGLPAWLTFDAGTRTFSGTPANANVGTVAITVRATDSGGAFVEDSFNITVANSNDAPTVANPIPNQNATEDSAFSFAFAANTFADVDIGDTFTYSAAGLPAWLTFDAGTRTFSGTPANANVGTVAITVRATDSGGAFVEDSFNITVANSNDAPTVANPIPNQNATEDSAFSFAFAANTFADVDIGDTFTYSAAGLPAWLTFDAGTRTFSGTPANANVGTVAITVRATDSGGAFVEDSFNITVANSNDAPTVANPIPNQNATEDSAFNFQFAANTFADVDIGDTFTYSAAGLPAWLTFDAGTRTFSGTPANADVGTVAITVRATDSGGAFVEDSFNITVANSNDAPTVANPIPNQNATEDSAFSFAFAANTFADVDIGDTFTYSAAGLPAWLTFDAGTRTFSGTPANANVGTVAITVRATDSGGAFVEDSFNITVANSNDAPTVANPIPNQNATEDSAFNFQFAANTFADVDIGDTFTYSAAGLPAWLTFDAGTRTFSGTPANADVGTVAITVRATDSGGAFVEDSFNITVANSNDAPTVANPIPNQNATEDSAFNFQFAANTFADVDIGDTFTYSAAGLPAWLTFDAGTRTFSGTPANANVGTVAITVRATDSGGAFVEDSFNITVANSNDAPTVANPIPNQNATEDVAFVFSFAANTFNDVDAGATLSYTAQLNGGGALPGWLIFNSPTRSFVGTPTNADVGTISIDVIANDGNGGTVTDTFSITVANVNDAPIITSNGGGATASISLTENTSAVTTVTASDADLPAQTLTYSIIGGADAGRFSLDSNTGALSFLVLPDFEAPADSDANNVYNLVVRVSDGSLSGSQAITVTVTNQNDNSVGPISDTNPAADSIAENAANGTAVDITAFASDADSTNNTVTYSLDNDAGGRFAIDANTGVVTVANSSLLDYEATTSHGITVLATSADGSTSSQGFTISLSPVNDNNPAITSDGGGATASLNIAENTTAVTTVTASDADLPAQTLSYSIIGGADAALFTINSSTGALSFITAPDFEVPTDSGGNNVYNLIVQVSDGALTDTQAIAVSVFNSNEAPTNSPLILTAIAEDSGPRLITQLELLANAADVDGPSLSALGLAISAGNGSLVSNGDGTWTYTPALNDNGSVSFAYTVTDGSLTTAGSATLGITPVNDAPTLANGTALTLPGTDENTASAPRTVASVLTGVSWADVDSAALKGAAITGAVGNGIWQYSTDGTTWTAFGAVAANNALLLADSSQVRYLPDGATVETASFSFVAWDRTTDGASANGAPSYADPGVGGGIAAYSSEAASASLNVMAAPNTAPALTPIAPGLSGISEDQIDNAGQTVASFVGASIIDADSGAVLGIAITATANGNGAWQYSLDGGTNWNAVGAVSNSSALLLRGSDRVRFVPDGLNATTASLGYRAWDQTSGSAGSLADAGSNGGTTAFSTAADSASLTVAAVNDAPVLSNGATVTLTAGSANTPTAPASVASLLSAAGWADVDAGAERGIAVTDTVGNGTWQYATDGATWTDFGTVSGRQALLLTDTTQLRYIAAGSTGATASISFLAWDQSAGTGSASGAPAYANPQAGGNTAAYSSQSASASISILPLGDTGETPFVTPPQINPDPQPPATTPLAPPSLATAPPGSATVPASSVPRSADPLFTVGPARDWLSIERTNSGDIMENALNTVDYSTASRRWNVFSPRLQMNLQQIALQDNLGFNLDAITQTNVTPAYATDRTRQESSNRPFEETVDGFTVFKGAAGVAGAAFSLGVIWWASRAAGLLASLAMTSPMWRNIDPLAVLGNTTDDSADWGRRADEEDVRDEKAVTSVLEEMTGRRF